MIRRLATALFLATAFAAPSGAQTSLDEMPEGWTTIAPGGDAMCATGTPYSFHVRPGARDRVVLFFNGGGACWSGELCDPSVEPTPYVPIAKADHNDPRRHGGIFNPDNPENPFTGWSQIFVSYCTGDVHLGHKDREYEKQDGTKVTIRHRGKLNAQAALDWTYENFPAPERIFVAGGSAGSIASPYYAAVVQEHYPQADVVQFGGGSGGYRMGPLKPTFEAWGLTESLPDWPETAPLRGENPNFEDLYRVAAARHPEIAFHAYNTAYDEAQVGFVRMFGSEGDLWELMQTNLGELHAEIPDFHSYTAGGTFHTILRFDLLYDYEVDGVRIVDWVRAAAHGQKVTNVSCEDEPGGCKEAPAIRVAP